MTSANMSMILVLLLVILLMVDILVAGTPIRPNYSDADQSMVNPEEAQRLFINQQFKRQVLRNFGEDDNGLNMDSNYIKRLMAQKRFSNMRQTRGGVALCLWKVCPAGPWLVQKK